MEDKELFELCKSVYEKTGWEPKPIDTSYFAQDLNIPVYTSDYLLAKLQSLPCEDERDEPYIYVKHGGVSKPEFRWDARANLGINKDYEVDADTPLKSLLKLTLALHEAGELPS